MSVSDIKLIVHTRTTKRLAVLMFLIKVMAWTRLFSIESAAKVIKWVSSKGWLYQYRIGKGDWTNLRFDLDYEITEG